MASDQQVNELAGRAARSVVWALCGTMAGKLVWLGALALLTRHLAPAEFGLVAFGLVTITYLESIGDLGASAALVFWPPEDRADLHHTAQATFWVNVAMGLGFFVLLQVAAPHVASFFHHPEGTAILRALAWGIPLKFLGNTHDALLRKELRFRARALPETGLSIAKSAVAIPFALAGHGAWSLVWGQLAGLAGWTALLWRLERWRPRLSVAGPRLRQVLEYGRGIVAVNLVAAVVHHADLVVVGRMLGATALGFYQVAYKLPEMTLALGIWVAGKVLFPTLAKLKGSGGDLALGLRSAVRYASAVLLPAAVGLAFLAAPVVDLLFGLEWRPAAPILTALALYLGVRAVGSPAGDLLKSTGRPHWLAGLGAARAVVLLPVLIVAGRHSSEAVAWSLAAVSAVGSLVNLGVAARFSGTSLAAALRGVASPALATLGMAVVLALWGQFGETYPGWIGLAARGVTAGGAYAILLHWLAPEIVRQGWQALRAGGWAVAAQPEGRRA